jgi:biopolymer transport protein ExbB
MTDAVVTLAPQEVGISSFAHFWVQGDAVSHAVVFLLFGMSVLSWTYILLKGWQFMRFGPARSAITQFWLAGSMEQGMEALSGHGALARMAAAGTAAAEGFEAQAHLGMQGEKSAVVTRALRQSMGDCILTLESGLTLLASIGAVAPFVGLFGTVWGIYHALLAIGVDGSASLGTVSGPVGEALIMTAAGLFVAIPAVLGYNAFSRAMRKAASELDGFAFDLQALLVTGQAKKPVLQVVQK